MSRSRAGTSFTTRSPMRMVPALTVSSPATMRSVVDLPQPDGPTRTRNSPSPITRSTLRTPSSVTLAMEAPFGEVREPALPRPVPLGRGDLGLPGRGLAARGGGRSAHLAQRLPPPGPPRQRRHRRRGLRPLPPLSRGRAPHEGARPLGLPLQHRLGAGPSAGHRGGERGRPRVLRPPGGRTARAGRRALRYALSLGPAGGARRAGRLAPPGRGPLVRRVRLGHGEGAGRPGGALGHAQRALGRGGGRLPDRRPRAGSPEPA